MVELTEAHKAISFWGPSGFTEALSAQKTYYGFWEITDEEMGFLGLTESFKGHQGLLGLIKCLLQRLRGSLNAA